MANNILQRAGGEVSLTITLASLASSVARVGVQSTFIDNGTLAYPKLELSVVIKLNNSSTPTANTGVHIHLLRANSVASTDSAASSAGALTQLNAPLLGVLRVGAAPAANQILEGFFIIHNPGELWGVQVWHDTGENVNTSGSAIQYRSLIPEIQ